MARTTKAKETTKVIEVKTAKRGRPSKAKIEATNVTTPTPVAVPKPVKEVKAAKSATAKSAKPSKVAAKPSGPRVRRKPTTEPAQEYKVDVVSKSESDTLKYFAFDITFVTRSPELQVTGRKIRTCTTVQAHAFTAVMLGGEPHASQTESAIAAYLARIGKTELLSDVISVDVADSQAYPVVVV